MAVLGAGFETWLVTADVTLQTWMCEEDLLRLEAAEGFAWQRTPPGLVRIWTPFMHRYVLHRPPRGHARALTTSPSCTIR